MMGEKNGHLLYFETRCRNVFKKKKKAHISNVEIICDMQIYYF